MRASRNLSKKEESSRTNTRNQCKWATVVGHIPVCIQRRFDVDFQSKIGRDVDLQNIGIVSTLLCRRFNDVKNSRYLDVESTSILCRQIPRRLNRRSLDVALSTFYRRQKQLFRR